MTGKGQNRRTVQKDRTGRLDRKDRNDRKINDISGTLHYRTDKLLYIYLRTDYTVNKL